MARKKFNVEEDVIILKITNTTHGSNDGKTFIDPAQWSELEDSLNKDLALRAAFSRLEKDLAIQGALSRHEEGHVG